MEQQSQASQDKLIPDPSGTGVLNILGIIDSFENLMKALDSLSTVGEAGNEFKQKVMCD